MAKVNNEAIRLHNKKIFEDRLKKILSDVCKKMGTQYAEWDTNELLYRTILSHPDRALPKVIAAFDAYDVYYSIAQELSINVDPRFEWFYNFNKSKK